MLKGNPNEWGLVIQSVADGTQPTTNRGTSITPGNNTYGSYAQMINGGTGWPTGSGDAYEIWININSAYTTGAARDMIVTIGLDPAGGTSYTDTINHLLCTGAGDWSGLGGGATGVWYRFPLRIPNGSSVAAKASVNNATVGTVHCHVMLFCQPSRPDLIKVGSFVRTFGDVTASSRGTLITPGSASEGAWTQLGSAVAEPLWFWEYGYGVDDLSIQGQTIVVDIGIGDATNKKLAIRNANISSSTAEALIKPAAGMYALAAVGDLIYGRAQTSVTPDSNVSLMAYGVGG